MPLPYCLAGSNGGPKDAFILFPCVKGKWDLFITFLLARTELESRAITILNGKGGTVLGSSSLMPSNISCVRHFSVTHAATLPATSENSPEHNAASLRLCWSSFQVPHCSMTQGEGCQGKIELSVWIMELQGNYPTE